MSMPIDVETLLNRLRIESERIEFKRGWNPAGIYRTICAFANDFDNLGGGYILVGVEQDERGVAKRPVVGIEDGDIDGILKDMVAYNNKFDPFLFFISHGHSSNLSMGKRCLQYGLPAGRIGLMPCRPT